MGINFSAFEIGRRALNANQTGINVTGQNIANVNTPGYSRRRLMLAESAPINVHGLNVGNGVSVAGIQSFRDAFIQSRIQAETGIAGRLTAQRDALGPVEAALQGSENGGIENALANFFGSFRDLEANPGSLPLRSLTAQRGAALASAFQSTRARLGEIRQSTDAQVQVSVEQANDLSSRIAELNQKVSAAEASGVEASGLRDQRAELATKLSELTGARATENPDGTLTLSIADGRPLVLGNKAFQLQAEQVPPLGLSTVSLGGEPAAITEGTIAGLLSAIDSASTQINDLDALAASVVQRVNDLHTSGTDLDGNAGVNFFNNSGTVTAANISVNSAVASDPRLIVASPLGQPGQTGTVAGSIANLLTDASSTAGTRTGSFSSIFGSMLSDAGDQISSANNDLETQAAVLSQAMAQRDSVSGVSLDEEAINLLQYQKAFEAAARFIKVADEMTQVIISLGQ